MKYEIGKEYDHKAVKEWPVGTIFKSQNPYLVNHGLWIVVSEGKIRGCHNAYYSDWHNLQSNDFSPNIDKSVFTPLEFGPEVFKIGDKIQPKDLYKLPAGSIVRLPLPVMTQTRKTQSFPLVNKTTD